VKRPRWFLAWFMTPTNRRVFLAPGGRYTFRQDAARAFTSRRAAIAALGAVPSRVRSPDFGNFVTVITKLPDIPHKEAQPP